MKMNLKESRGEDTNDSSPMTHLPDEVILQILNKLIDLRTLCCCYLVSRRFSSIVLQVDAIAFTAPYIPDKNTVVGDVAPLLPNISSFFGESFLDAIRFLSKFKGVKSLCIQLPSSFSHIGGINNRCLFKWKVNFGRRVDSFLFLSPNSICDKDGFYLNGIRDGEEEEDMGFTNILLNQKFSIMFKCLKDVFAWHLMLMYIIKDLPMLEEVSIGRLSLSGGKLSEVKEWLHSVSQTEFNRIQVPDRVSRCYIPVLNLPVSGYVMKGVFCGLAEMNDLQGRNDGLINSEYGFEQDKEEAAYTEALKEILEKHKGTMRTYVL